MSTDPFATPSGTAPTPPPLPSQVAPMPGPGEPAFAAPPPTIGESRLVALVAASVLLVTGLLLSVATSTSWDVDPNDPANLTQSLGYGAAGLFYMLGLLFMYVAGCVWQMRLRGVAQALGRPVPATWKVWAGWWIPLYSLVAPYRVMRELAEAVRAPQVNVALGIWWTGILAGQFFDRLSMFATDDAQMVGLMACKTLFDLCAAGGIIVLIVRVSAAANEAARQATATLPPPYVPVVAPPPPYQG